MFQIAKNKNALFSRALGIFWNGNSGGALKARLSMPVGQAIPDGYTALDGDLPFMAAQYHFGATVTENRAKPNRLLAITNAGVLLAERVYSFTSINADIAASFAPLDTFHVLHDPTREPAALTVSATPGATNYWKDVLTQRVAAYAAGITGFATIPIIELCNELVIPGGYATSIFRTAAAADGTWALPAEVAAAVVLYDALAALGGSRRYAVGEYQLEDGGMGVAVDPPQVNHGVSRARKRPQMVKWWHDFLAARQIRPIMRLQAHLDASVPFYLSELRFFIDEMAGMLRIDCAIGELNVAWSNADQLFPYSQAQQIRRDFGADLSSFICKEVALRAGLQSLIGWTDFQTDGLDRMTIMETGALSELGQQIRTDLANLPAPTLRKRAISIVGLTAAGEAQALPYWSGITTMGWGAYGTGGVMTLDLGRFKQRTSDGAAPSKAATHNATIIYSGRIKSVGSGRTLFQMKDASSNVLASAQTTVSGTVSVTLQGTTTDLGAYAAGDLVRIAIDQNGTTAMRAAMGRYTSNGAHVLSSVVTRATPAATDAATMVFPETSGEIRAFAVEMWYDTSRLALDASLLAELDAEPENHVNPTTLSTTPASLSITGSVIAENTTQGTAVGVAAPVNASNPSPVSILSQDIPNALAIDADGTTIIVGSGYADLNYEVPANRTFSATFSFSDDKGTYQATQDFIVTDVADGPTTAGAATNLDAFLGAPTAGAATTGDLRTLFVSPTGQTLSFTVSPGTVSGGFNFSWTPSAAGSATVSVTATDQDGQSLTIQTTVTVAAANQPPVAGNVTLTFIVPPPAAGVAPSNTVAPTLSGTQKVGQTLTVSNGTWTGDAPITYTYQWQQSANGTTGWADISGATPSSYTLVAGDDLKFVRANVTGTNATGNATASSAASSQILYNAPSNSVAPAITGTAQVGNTLTTDDGTWANSPSFTRKWQVSNDGSTGWTDISGATSTTFLVTSAEQAKYLRSFVTGTNSGGSATANSVATAQVAAAASPPTYFGRTSATPSSSAISVAWPASHAVNDVGLLLIPSGGDEPSTQDLSGLGWTSLGLVSQTGPTTSAYRQIRAWWKRAASTTEPSVSLNDTGAINGGDIFVIRGCRTTGDPVALLGQSFGTSASLQVVIPTANTSGPQRFILGYFTLALDSTTAQMAGGYSNANLTSLTNRLSNQSVASIGIGRYSFDGVLAAQGAVGNTTGTIATDGLNWVSALFEFIP